MNTWSITCYTALVGKFIFVYCHLYIVNAISNRNMLLSDLQHVRRLAECLEFLEQIVQEQG